MGKVNAYLMDQEDTSRDILDDLIDELDSAGAVLASHGECRGGRRNCSGAFSEFVISVGKAQRRATLRLQP